MVQRAESISGALLRGSLAIVYAGGDMARRKVMSREYKVMLRPSRFRGKEKALLEAAKAIWHDFSKSVTDIVVSLEGDLAQIRMHRSIIFYDTRDRLLNNAHYIFRQRRDANTRERDITLKFRHPDRYVAQDRNMDASHSTDGRTKFEEDIKVPFVSLYSFSTRLKIGNDTVFKELGDIRRLFLDMADKIDKFRDDEPLAAVNGFTARELVLSGASLRVGKTPKVDAECGLVVWYDENGEPDTPVAVELSYRYGDENEDYGGGLTRRGFEIFNALQSQLTEWVDPKPRTKTAFVYQ